MAFQYFSKDYLIILILLQFEHFLLSLTGVFPVILILDSNDLE